MHRTAPWLVGWKERGWGFLGCMLNHREPEGASWLRQGEVSSGPCSQGFQCLVCSPDWKAFAVCRPTSVQGDALHVLLHGPVLQQEQLKGATPNTGDRHLIQRYRQEMVLCAANAPSCWTCTRLI